MQRRAGGCTRGEVRSRRSVRHFGLAGLNDADDVADSRGNLAADREVLAPKKRMVGLGCNAATRTIEFFEDAPRSTG